MGSQNLIDVLYISAVHNIYMETSRVFSLIESKFPLIAQNRVSSLGHCHLLDIPKRILLHTMFKASARDWGRYSVCTYGL